MTIINKTEELKQFLKVVKESGNFQTEGPDITGGLYVQLLKNPYDYFYVRDSNLVYPNRTHVTDKNKNIVDEVKNVGSLGKPVIFPNSFSLKSGMFTNGFFNRRNEDLIHLNFCKVLNSYSDRILETHTYYKCFQDEKCYFLVWDLDFIDSINRKKWVSILEKKWNENCRNLYAVLTNVEIQNKRESLGLINRLKSYKRGDWSHIDHRIDSRALTTIYEKLFENLNNVTKKIEELLKNNNMSTDKEIINQIEIIWKENFHL